MMWKKISVAIGIVLFVGFLVVALCFSFGTTGDTATMISGLWSALATVVLGLIALFQNIRYKKLSDQASVNMKDTQNEIKQLTEKMSTAITALQNIEKAKYYPDLQEISYMVFGFKNGKYKELKEDGDTVFQYNYFNIDTSQGIDSESLIENCNSFAFCLKNIGEKTIRNFTCTDIEFTPITGQGHMIIQTACDIKEGQHVMVCFINIPDYAVLEGYDLNMTMNMHNLISESYESSADITFYLSGDGSPSARLDYFPPALSDKN